MIMNNAQLQRGASGGTAESWPRRVARVMRFNAIDLWQHVLRNRIAYLLLLVASVAAGHYLGLNFTTSVPERLVWLEHGVQPGRGELVVFRFEGYGPSARLKGARLLKRVQGVPGDTITVVEREVFINGVSVGVAHSRSPRGTVLEPIAPGVVPPGYFYVAGTNVDSLDSRYSTVGLIRNDQLIARAHAIF